MESSILLPLLSSLLWSLNPAIISRYAKTAPPFMLTSVRAVLASALVGAMLLASSDRVSFSPPSAVILAVASGVVGLGIGEVAYTRSIQLLGGSLAVVVGYTYMFFAQWFSVLMLGEPVSRSAALGCLLAFTGVFLASYRKEHGDVNRGGLLCALTTAMLWGLSAVLIKAAENRCTALLVAFLRLVPVPLIDLPLSLVRGERVSTSRDFLLVALVTGILGWGIGMVLYVYSIYVLGISVTVIATAFTPIFSQFTIRFVSGERTSPRVLIGALLVGSGVALQLYPLHG